MILPDVREQWWSAREWIPASDLPKVAEKRCSTPESVMDDMKLMGFPIGIGIMIGTVVGAMIGEGLAIGVGMTISMILGAVIGAVFRTSSKPQS